MPVYRVLLTRTAESMLEAIPDARIRGVIARRIDALKNDPEIQGTPLLGELSELRSLRAAGQRYRVLYRIERLRVTVVVVATGIRKEGSASDIYALAARLLRLGLLDTER